MWHNTLKAYRQGQNIMRFPLSSPNKNNDDKRPFRVLDIGKYTNCFKYNS